MTQNEYFNSQAFADTYHYEGDLGCRVGAFGTSFSVWAPTASSVILNLYEAGDGGQVIRKENLIAADHGVWKFETVENLSGMYYTYQVTVDGLCQMTADPYARACGLNGKRSMVIDMRDTDPEGFSKDQAPPYQAENIIYELHVRDFSISPSSGVSKEKRGKYLGLCEEGTSLYGDGIHATGLDYLKKLGVTHIQLMPVYDFGSVDEADPLKNYNWGYDPVNYNVPEGSYCSDPYHGEVRIKELKKTIMTLHQHGFRVIMDVVYNHTYHLDSYLNRMVPGYYYRFYEDGRVSDGSGCGNDTASERSMCAKYIIDSVLYWAREYHFDGFRFDLMGLLPVDLMNRIRRTLDHTFGPGEKLVFGEPWRAAESAVIPGTLLSDKTNLTRLLPGVGAFCDATRDAVKGDLMKDDAKGFVNGGQFDKSLFEGCLQGFAEIPGEYSVRTANQTIQYLSCHDDWTLWDRLVRTLDEGLNFNAINEQLLKANRLAIAILSVCQGNLFLLAGEEFGRTKHGIKNSFASPTEVNLLDWERAWQNDSLRCYYEGLFKFRKLCPCLCDKTEHAKNSLLSVDYMEDALVAVTLCDKEGSKYEKLLLLFNMAKENKTFKLPLGAYKLLVDHDNSFWWKEKIYVKDQVILPSMTAMFLGV